MDGSLAANLYKQDSEQQTCYSRGKQALARWSINTEIKTAKGEVVASVLVGPCCPALLNYTDADVLTVVLLGK